jgi:hypothetical protein
LILIHYLPILLSLGQGIFLENREIFRWQFLGIVAAD